MSFKRAKWSSLIRNHIGDIGAKWRINHTKSKAIYFKWPFIWIVFFNALTWVFIYSETCVVWLLFITLLAVTQFIIKLNRRFVSFSKDINSRRFRLLFWIFLHYSHWMIKKNFFFQNFVTHHNLTFQNVFQMVIYFSIQLIKNIFRVICFFIWLRSFLHCWTILLKSSN